MVGEDVQRQYDLVSFDPRGVQRSSPVTCVDGPALDELIASDPDYSTDAGIQARDRHLRGARRGLPAEHRARSSATSTR